MCRNRGNGAQRMPQKWGYKKERDNRNNKDMRLTYLLALAEEHCWFESDVLVWSAVDP